MGILSRVKKKRKPIERLSTGCEGLDVVLGGGLPKGRLYVVQGDPGAGKTTLGLQFLLEGVKRKERCLLLPLSETREEIESIADSHGWSLDGIDIHELASAGPEIAEESTLFHPAEVELNETIDDVVAAADRLEPSRLVFDSLSELRLLATNPLRYRRQILALKKLFAARECTVVLLDDRTGPKDDASSIAHGVIEISQEAPVYGPDRRRIHVNKMRGVSFSEGYHDVQIETGGLVVHPRLQVSDHAGEEHEGEMKSGLAPLDKMFGGGLALGTTALFLGPAGSGKSSLAMQYVHAAVKRGDHAAIFNFDESSNTILLRAKALGVDLKKYMSANKALLRQVDPTELPPGELITAVRNAVETLGSKLVVIDSLNGYLHSMPEERFMLTHLHDLLAYLRHRGVVCILVVAQHGLMGSGMKSPVDVSYLADTVLIFRYFEHRGRIRKAFSVLKKRTGDHETSIHELSMSSAGLQVGPALEELEGVLTGGPHPVDEEETSAAKGRAGGKHKAR